MEQNKGIFGFVSNGMDKALGGIIPQSPEEIALIAAKRRRDQEEAARILLEKQQPQVQVVNPDMAKAEAAQAQAQAQQTAAGAKAAESQMKIDENGKLIQTTVGGKVMDAIFGSWFK